MVTCTTGIITCFKMASSENFVAASVTWQWRSIITTEGIGAWYSGKRNNAGVGVGGENLSNWLTWLCYHLPYANKRRKWKNGSIAVLMLIPYTLHSFVPSVPLNHQMGPWENSIKKDGILVLGSSEAAIGKEKVLIWRLSLCFLLFWIVLTLTIGPLMYEYVESSYI